jgi:hypothetical protein
MTKEMLHVDHHFDPQRAARDADPTARMNRIREGFGLPPKAAPIVDDEGEAEVTEPPKNPEPPKTVRAAPNWWSTNPTELQADVNARAAELGIDSSDRELAELARQTWKSEIEYWRRCAEVLSRRSAKAEKANSVGAGAVIGETSTTPVIASTEDLAQELDSIQRGPDPTSVKNTARRKAIREELRRAR